MNGFKWTTAKGLSWHDNAFGPWKVGKTLEVPDAPKNGEPCGVGLHIGKTAEVAIGHGKFPGRLFEVVGLGECLGQDAQKARFASVNVIREIEKPEWVYRTEDFIESIARVKWFKPGRRKPKAEWKHHETRAAAWDAARAAAGAAARDAAWAAAGDAARDAARAAAGAAARDAARDAAGDAARDAAGDAAWAAAGAAEYEIVSDLDFPNKKKHAAHIAARWEVWTMGYGLVCDVNGEFYTYSKP